MDENALRDEIKRLAPWHHDVEVARGIRTGDPALAHGGDPELGTPTVNNPVRDMEMLVADIFPEGLAGRSFLDCACNAGGHAFAARALGAGRCFGFDAREHWIRQARFLARHLPSEGIDFATATLAELPAGETFDVTLFRGIFYHLPDPVAGLRIAADRTAELIVVNTAALPRPDKALVLERESRTLAMSGVDGLAWLPTGPEVMKEILAWCGFPHSRVRFNRRTATEWNRMEVLGARDAATFAHFDTLPHEAARYDAAPTGGAGPRARLRRGVKRLLGRG
jgi:SAM-dependent methyltransferase